MNLFLSKISLHQSWHKPLSSPHNRHFFLAQFASKSRTILILYPSFLSEGLRLLFYFLGDVSSLGKWSHIFTLTCIWLGNSNSSFPFKQDVVKSEKLKSFFYVNYFTLLWDHEWEFLATLWQDCELNDKYHISCLAQVFKLDMKLERK